LINSLLDLLTTILTRADIIKFSLVLEVEEGEDTAIATLTDLATGEEEGIREETSASHRQSQRQSERVRNRQRLRNPEARRPRDTPPNITTPMKTMEIMDMGKTINCHS
jgi:hypothetical protein